MKTKQNLIKAITDYVEENGKRAGEKDKLIPAGDQQAHIGYLMQILKTLKQK